MCTLFCPQLCTRNLPEVWFRKKHVLELPWVHPFCPPFDVPWGSGSDPTAKSLNSGPSPVQSWAAGCQPTWWSSRVSRKPRQHEPPWTGNPWWRAHHWWCATGTAEKKEWLGVACRFVVLSPVRRSRSCWTLLDFVGATNPRKKTYRYIYQKP